MQLLAIDDARILRKIGINVLALVALALVLVGVSAVIG